MDGNNFDRFVRALGAGQSRRSVIKGLVGTWIGGAAAVTTIAQAGAQEQCLEIYSTCNVFSNESTCCEGTSCFWPNDEGFGYCEYNEYICPIPGESCAETPCCGGLTCNDSLVCESDNYETCGVEDQFCGYYDEGEYRACCDGYECYNWGEGSSCLQFCAFEGEYCGPRDLDRVALAQEDWGCCGDLVCNDEDVCVPPPPPICAAETEACGLIGDVEIACCDGLTCIETDGDAGICGIPEEPETPEPPKTPEIPVTRLPDTGAGSSPDTASWIAPAAAAAAAAVIGAKLLKDGTSETSDVAS